ncbi:hypothetical protein ScPMuIL_011581 [Solemya velum]
MSEGTGRVEGDLWFSFFPQFIIPRMSNLQSTRPTVNASARWGPVLPSMDGGIVLSEHQEHSGRNQVFLFVGTKELGFGKTGLEGKIQDEVTCLLAEIEKQNGCPFDMSSLLQNAVSNVICSLLFGHRFEYDDEEFHSLIHCGGDPEAFRPSRFLDENGQIMRAKTDKVIAFSMGRRACIGESLAKMELFLFLTAMVQKFKFLPPNGESPPSLDGIYGVTRSPVNFRIRAVS